MCQPRRAAKGGGREGKEGLLFLKKKKQKDFCECAPVAIGHGRKE
jgi:hypothetical protein